MERSQVWGIASQRVATLMTALRESFVWTSESGIENPMTVIGLELGGTWIRAVSVDVVRGSDQGTGRVRTPVDPRQAVLALGDLWEQLGASPTVGFAAAAILDAEAGYSVGQRSSIRRHEHSCGILKLRGNPVCIGRCFGSSRCRAFPFDRK